MLDLINCRDGPEDVTLPSYRVHSTVLSEDKNFAITKAGGFILRCLLIFYNTKILLFLITAYLFRTDEHVFENYGQPNHIYFTYHGFTLQRNAFDCVQFLIEMTKKEIDAVNWNDAKSIAQVAWSVLSFLFLFFTFKRYIIYTQSIGLRNNQPPSLSVCLSVPVQANIWTFLSLKVKTKCCLAVTF